jgi:cytochrome b6-f complex iron-sulfur subunit
MNEEIKELDGCGSDAQPDNARRHFLRQAACATGLVVALPSLSLAADEKADDAPEKISDDVVLKTGEHKALNKIGGSEVVATEAGKLIVARTGESSFAACSAICPHKGAQLEYDHGGKKFVCPLHHSEFDLNGKLLSGPAKTNLKSYVSQAAAVVTLKTEA